MPEYICVTVNTWGAKPRLRRQWHPGETVSHHECPNEHFEPIDPFEKQVTNEGYDVPVNSMLIKWDEYTKAQLNERFKLGYTVDALLKIRKSQLIKESKEVLKEEY